VPKLSFLVAHYHNVGLFKTAVFREHSLLISSEGTANLPSHRGALKVGVPGQSLSIPVHVGDRSM
jgi:hypothetical protein